MQDDRMLKEVLERKVLNSREGNAQDKMEAVKRGRNL